MSKFKMGDLARCTKSTGSPPEYTAGKVYRISSVYMDRIGTEADDRGSTTNGWGEENFEKVTEPKFKVGDRVYYEFGDVKKAGTVINIPDSKHGLPHFDGTEVWAEWDHSGEGWMPADRVFADKTRGQIISELRKAAGLPAFVVGDVVKILDNKAPAGNTKPLAIGAQTTITAVAGTYDVCGWMLNGSGGFFYTEIQLELVSPAAASATPEPRSTERAFVVNQWVRVIDGDQIGQVTEDDGDDEDRVPYTVEFLDGEDEIFSAEELIPWIPHINERVQLIDGYVPDHGTVRELDLGGMKFYADWDDGNGNYCPFPIEHIVPSDKPAPRKRLKKGDRVAYLGNTFTLNMPKGALATLYEDQEGSTIRIKWDTRGAALDGAYNVYAFEFTTAPEVVEQTTTFKRGDIVEVINPQILRAGTKVGDLGIIKDADARSMLLNHSKDGIIGQIYKSGVLKLAA